MDFLGGFIDVAGMVADALEVADGVQQHADFVAVLLGQIPSGELDQIGADLVFIRINDIFVLFHAVGAFGIPFMGQGHGLQQIGAHQFGHVVGLAAAVLHCHGGSGQQTLVQHFGLAGVFMVRDCEVCQLFQSTGKRK